MTNNQSITPLKMLLFCFHATNTIILSYLPLYLKYKSLTETEIGWVLAVGPLAAIVAQPFWGYLSDKYKTVKLMIQICIVGLLFSSILFFQMNGLIMLIFTGAIFYFFTSPIGALGDSLAQRRADELHISFGTIRMWGSVGFATSSLIVGEVLTRVGIQYMIWPYLLFGTIALAVSFKLADVKVDSDPIQLKDVRQIFQNKAFVYFLLLMLFITITHRASDSYIGLYIMELGGSERFVGMSWFVGVLSEAAVFALAGLWFRKLHPFIFVIIAGALYSTRWFLYSVATDPTYIIFLQVLHGLTFGVFYVAAFSYISRLIPNLLQSTGHLIFFATFFGVSGIVGSLAGGAIIDIAGGATLYFIMGVSALIGTGLMIAHHMLPFGKEKSLRSDS
ncbi:MAG TPA: MFS transporter [Virgibacillus sp.]|nr:MFS transporter [Virgibacillus sp.]